MYNKKASKLIFFRLNEFPFSLHVNTAFSDEINLIQQITFFARRLNISYRKRDLWAVFIIDVLTEENDKFLILTQTRFIKSNLQKLLKDDRVTSFSYYIWNVVAFLLNYASNNLNQYEKKWEIKNSYYCLIPPIFNFTVAHHAPNSTIFGKICKEKYEELCIKDIDSEKKAAVTQLEFVIKSQTFIWLLHEYESLKSLP